MKLNEDFQVGRRNLPMLLSRIELVLIVAFFVGVVAKSVVAFPLACKVTGEPLGVAGRVKSSSAAATALSVSSLVEASALQAANTTGGCVTTARGQRWKI
ncbi:hypothetical protein V6N13_035180 [Hibiscus sabdariffa]